MILHKKTYMEEFDLLKNFYSFSPEMQYLVYESAFNYYRARAAVKYLHALRTKVLPLSVSSDSREETLEEIGIVKRDCSELAEELNEIVDAQENFN